MQPYQTLTGNFTRRRSSVPTNHELGLRTLRISPSGGSLPGWSDTQEESDSNEGSEHDEDNDNMCTWTLRTQPSIYDEALIAPIVHCQHGGHSTAFFTNLCGTFTVLAVNVILQLLVTTKVGRLTRQQRMEMENKLWTLCKEREASMPFTRLLDREMDTLPLGSYFSCGPLSVTMMSHLENVDQNGDGFWTQDEAVLLNNIWEQTYTKQASLEGVWEYYAHAFRKDAGLAKSPLNTTHVPMGWMNQWQKTIDLCIITDSQLCGNLEVRGILPLKLPELAGDSMQRISRCEEIVNQECPTVFGELHRLNTRWSSELCGGTVTKWLPSRRIMTVDYNLVLKYVKDSDSITTEYYFVFVVVILLIWVMSMVQEIREIVNWWMVLLPFPTTPKIEGIWVERGPDSIAIWAIPRPHKLATLWLNLLPRTLACLFLSYIGSIFLIQSDDYGELIQNGVALGFLIEIDNMLFSAVSREVDKELVMSCEPLVVEVRCPRCKKGSAFRAFPVGATYTVLILIVTFGMISYEYTKKGGKYDLAMALRCLCHASGRNCVAAQILGGYESVIAATRIDPG